MLEAARGIVHDWSWEDQLSTDVSIEESISSFTYADMAALVACAVVAVRKEARPSSASAMAASMAISLSLNWSQLSDDTLK